MPIPLGILAVAGAGAAGGGNSFDLLETTLITSNTASVTFSNLNTYSDYKHLQVRFTARNSNTTSGDIALRINGDSGSNYAYHWLRGSGSAVGSFAATSQTVARAGLIIPSDGVTNNFGPSIIDILDFSNTSKNTTIKVFYGIHDNVGASNEIGLNSALWNNTSAVTSLAFTPPGSGNFVSGSRFSLYGIK
jgi:hypothetical protein